MHTTYHLPTGAREEGRNKGRRGGGCFFCADQTWCQRQTRSDIAIPRIAALLRECCARILHIVGLVPRLCIDYRQKAAGTILVRKRERCGPGWGCVVVWCCVLRDE